MLVYLTGGTGFVGSYILRALLQQGHRVRALVRDRASLVTDDERVEPVQGNVTEPETLAGHFAGCDAVIHLVGIIEEKPLKGMTFENVHFQGTRHVADAAKKAGTETFILMSANGVRPENGTGYQTSKWRAEQYIKSKNFRHWTIFRPSLIFGKPGPGDFSFETRLVDTLIKPFPILPILGDGEYKLQPVAVEEVAAAFVQALANPKTHGKTYCPAGPEVLTFNEIVDRLQQAMGRKPKPRLHQPLWLMRPLVNLLGPLGILPITPAQFALLVEGNTCDSTAFYRDFDLGTPKRFVPENLAYVG